LHHIAVVASTVAPNGDQNPYGLTLETFKDSPFYGDLLVSDFSNAAGINGEGQSIVAINPATGQTRLYSQDAQYGPVALAVSPKGPLWIANFGGLDAQSQNDEVLAPNGHEFPDNGSFITNSVNPQAKLAGPWGQVFVPNRTAPTFLVTNVLNGTIEAMYDFSPPNFSTDTKFLTIGQGLAHRGTNANNAVGPQGMVYDPATGKVYVVDGADNSIRAYSWQGPTTPNQGQGQLIFRGGPLRQPAGITIDPVNGDLLVVNQGNNNLVEIRLPHQNPQGRWIAAHPVAVKRLDKTPVNPVTGAGSALFGVWATTRAGHLVVYFTNDNTNTVDMLY
jgi:DNA-binding beta-propeller fold protein YncE